MPALMGTKAPLSYVQCFLYLVSSLINVSIFSYHMDGYFLDIPRITLYVAYIYSIYNFINL